MKLYHKFAGLGRTSTNLEKMISDSYFGRVYILFITSDLQQWGKYDPVTNTVEVHPKEKSCDVDLLDFAAANTLARRGEVYVVAADKVPDGGIAAAVFRY